MIDSELYKRNIIEHYKNPRNFGKIEKYTHSACLSNVTCGDELSVCIVLEEGIIKDIAFDGIGCAISISAMSMLTEKLKGKKAEFIDDITDEDVLNMLGMENSSPRLKCALLGIQTLRKLTS